ASFILEAGTSTVSCLAVFALRILVSISAIGSFVVISRLLSCFLGLPACFLHTRDLSCVGQFTEANSADAVFSQVSMLTSADSAAVIFSGREFLFALLFDFHRCLSHEIPSYLANG